MTMSRLRKPRKSYHCSFCGKDTPRARPLFRAGAICYTCLNERKSPCLLCYDAISTDEHAVIVEDYIPFEKEIREIVRKENAIPELRLIKGGEQYLLLAKRPYHGKEVNLLSDQNYICGCCGMPIVLDRNSPDAADSSASISDRETERLMNLYGRPVCLDCQRSGYWQFEEYLKNKQLTNTVLKRSFFHRISQLDCFNEYPGENGSSSILDRFSELCMEKAVPFVSGSSTRTKEMSENSKKSVFHTFFSLFSKNNQTDSEDNPNTIANSQSAEKMNRNIEPTVPDTPSAGLFFLPKALDCLWESVEFSTHMIKTPNRLHDKTYLALDPVGDQLFAIPSHFKRSNHAKTTIISYIDTPAKIQIEHGLILLWSIIFKNLYNIELCNPLDFRYEISWFTTSTVQECEDSDNDIENIDNRTPKSWILLLRAGVINEVVQLLKSIYGDSSAYEQYITSAHPILSRAMHAIPNFYGSSPRLEISDILDQHKLHIHSSNFVSYAEEYISLWKIEDTLLLHSRITELGISVNDNDRRINS